MTKISEILSVSDKERATAAEKLVTLAQLVGAIHTNVAGAEVVAQRAGIDIEPIKPLIASALDLLGKAREEHTVLATVLHRSGVVAPLTSTQQPPADDPSSLATIHDDSRELLDLLERAQAVAERLDAMRGRAADEKIPLQPGESRGTDWAETISYLTLRARREATGGKSKHE